MCIIQSTCDPPEDQQPPLGGEQVAEERSGPKRDEVREGWRRFHNDIHDLYSSPNIIIIKSRKMTCRACSMYWE
jgi:hypothetical protein